MTAGQELQGCNEKEWSVGVFLTALMVLFGGALHGFTKLDNIGSTLPGVGCDAKAAVRSCKYLKIFF
uniref:Uncharacterized protein n=1 Tax=Desulfobacca acetoxidans TaxID=60893 RepID=A0A7V6A1Q6_9BACT